MLQLDLDVIEKVLLNLEINDITSLSEVNSGFHKTIRKIPSVQYKLYKKKYHYHDDGHQDEDEDKGINPSTGILNLIEKERNLLSLTPRINQFNIGPDQKVYSAQINYLITIPLHDYSVAVNESNLPFVEEIEKIELYTILKFSNLNSKQIIYTHCKPIKNSLLVNISKDLVVYVDVEGYIHISHFYGQNSDGQLKPYTTSGKEGIEIHSSDWDRKNLDKIKITLIKDDKLVVDLGVKWYIINWKEGKISHKFPHRGTWNSISGSIITHDGLLIGLDIPILPWMPAIKPKIANLAVFNISDPPAEPYLPELYLELPYCYPLLTKTICALRNIPNIPKNEKISIPLGESPKLHEQVQNPTFVRLTFPFIELISGYSKELNIVIPINQIETIKIENYEKPWIKGRTWRRSNNPLDGVRTIYFEKWLKRSIIWIESTSYKGISLSLSLSLRLIETEKQKQSINGVEEYQIGKRLIKLDNLALNEKGNLNLEISDFNYHEIVNPNKYIGALKSIELDLAPKDGEKPNKPRTAPYQYKVQKRGPSSCCPPIIRCSGQFSLGLPGEVENLITDNNGQKLIIQQKNNHHLWILNFAA